MARQRKINRAFKRARMILPHARLYMTDPKDIDKIERAHTPRENTPHVLRDKDKDEGASSTNEPRSPVSDRPTTREGMPPKGKRPTAKDFQCDNPDCCIPPPEGGA